MYGRGCLGRGLPHWGGRGAVGSAGGPPFASWGRVGDGFCIGVWKSWFWNIYLSGDPPHACSVLGRKIPKPTRAAQSPKFRGAGGLWAALPGLLGFGGTLSWLDL